MTLIWEVGSLFSGEVTIHDYGIGFNNLMRVDYL